MASCSKTGVCTRKQTEIWLIGQISSSLGTTKLPSKREVMAMFFYYKKEQKQTIREACNSAANAILEVWTKARIPTSHKPDIVNKVERLFREWEKLKKNKENKAKRSESLQQKENEWKDVLEDLFDVSHARVFELIKIQEDKEFLLAQQEKGRRGKMGGVDRELSKKEENSLKRAEVFRKRQEQEEESARSRKEVVHLASSSSSDDDELKDRVPDSNDAGVGAAMQGASASKLHSTSKRGRKNIIDERLALSLDVAKVSDRKAAIVLCPTIQHLGHDPAEYNLNPSSIRRQRKKFRCSIAEGLKQNFVASVPLTIHWDGKILEDIVGREIVDRLPILISGEGIDQLLAVPKLSSGKGTTIASAVYDTALDWNICNQVKCMCFDTTAVNTGLRNGACRLLEQKLGKDMLWLACRHHVMELVLEAVVLHSLGSSTGPDISLFKIFQKSWAPIDKSKFQTATSDVTCAHAVADIADDVTAFALDQLQKFQPRDDYRELLELAVVFLGRLPEKGISFKSPAGIHRARWMSKAIYSLKVWMFRRQLTLSEAEETGVRNICLFVIKVYLKFWFEAASAVSAPRNDLLFLSKLDKYAEDNKDISKVALNKFLLHLWYLSEELVALAFFDDEVKIETKRSMVQALETPGGEDPAKRITLDPQLIKTKQLSDFVTSNTRRFFTIMGVQSSFIVKDASQWEDDEDYKSAKATVRCLRVVNDIAERGVALMEEYNKLHTNNEEQKQFLLLIVKEYRKQHADTKKATLMK